MKSVPKHGIRTIDSEVLKDIDWWAKFIETYNGVSCIHEPDWRKPDTVISSDACPMGLGGFCDGEYYHTNIPNFITKDKNVHINELECLALGYCFEDLGKKFLWSQPANAL